MWEGEGFGEGEIGEVEGERGCLIGRKGGEVGEIGSLAEADLEGETEVGGGVDGLGDPVFFGSHEHSGEVEEIGLGRGEFKIGDEGIDEGEGFLTGGFYGGGIGVEEEEVGAAGEASDLSLIHI